MISPHPTPTPQQQGKAEEVTWEDQQHICAFGRFNTRLHEVNAELKAKAVSVHLRPTHLHPKINKKENQNFC